MSRCSIKDLFQKVMEVYSLSFLHDEWLFKRLQQLMGKIGDGKEPLIEKLFLKLFERAEVCYMAQHKLDLTEYTVREFIYQKKKIFVFFERIAAADYVNDNIALRAGKQLVDKISDNGNLWCKAYHSQISKQDRRQILKEFQNIDSGALVVCRSLDEGLDVPDADGAILAASTKSLRQRIQRIGRVLRRGDGKKMPTIVTLFAKGTGDSEVTCEDRREFEGVASIYTPMEKARYIELIRTIPLMHYAKHEISRKERRQIMRLIEYNRKKEEEQKALSSENRSSLENSDLK